MALFCLLNLYKRVDIIEFCGLISTELTIIVKLTDVKLIKFLNRIPYKDQLLTKQDVTANKEIHEECPTSKTW